MRVNHWRRAIAIALGVGILSCTESPTGPMTPASVELSVTNDVLLAAPQLVISQVYGGGGNSGATYKNDFIELFNPGTVAVNVTGWSVQYGSSGGTTWLVTTLSGSIPAGGYYLVQEAAGTGGTVDLPTPDATGTIAMSGTAAKVALVQSTTALSGACPASGSFVDQVSYGTTNTCGTSSGSLTNTTSLSRNSGGCAYTGSTAADFTIGAVAPRNSATPVNVCPTETAPPATATVAPDGASIAVGATQSFTATARDASDNVVSTTFTWSSSDEGVATIDANGLATGIAPGSTTITATTANGKSGDVELVVVAAPIVAGDVVISQIYGGGGNSGAKYTHDYVELFNRGTETANVTGWTVQYSSASGASWAAVTLPSATIAPGKYYLVQLASNAAVGAPLPTADATGSMNMAGGSGKVILTLPDAVTSGIACPNGALIIDHVGYGTSSNCTTDWNGSTSNLTNTTAAFRKNDGCVKTGSITNDFVVLEANPHNSTSTSKNCESVTRPPSATTIVINELMGDPANAETASWGEWFEVHNYGTSPINLNGWTIISGGTSQPDHTISSDVIVPAGGFAVLGRGADMLRNGGVSLDYNYFVGTATTIWLDDSDFLMLVDNTGARSDSVAWTSMAHGVTRALRDPLLPHADASGSNWGYSTTLFGDGDYGTPGAANGTLADIAPVVSANKITISGRVATDAPLPVGFESQLFAFQKNSSGQDIVTTFTWLTLTPEIASIDSRGVIHANAEGTAQFKVTAADGTFRVHTLSMITAVASTTAQYLDNAAFGEPADNDPSDDFIIRRAQYTTSFNRNLGTPNWVAYDLNATDIAPGQDRCNCFTFDPELITAGFTPYNTADYTGAGAFLGPNIGVDRGHMVRSFDRTAGTLDNARTFYFSNVVPQFSDLNQGPWANMENDLGALAQNQNKEVYIYAGPAGTLGSVKNEGKINFPKYTWKIALILPRGDGLLDVDDYQDAQVIAVVMPNMTGVRNVDWHTYQVTVDSVESLTGYDLLSLLPDPIEIAVESRTVPPVAAVDGPYSAITNESISLSAAGSTDGDSQVLTYAWDFGDGTTGSGVNVTHTYVAAGTYTVRLIVSDPLTLADTVTTSATIITPAAAIENARAMIDGLATSGKLGSGNATSLTSKLNAALASLSRGNPALAASQLIATRNQINSLVADGVLEASDAAPLLELIDRIIGAIT